MPTAGKRKLIVMLVVGLSSTVAHGIRSSAVGPQAGSRLPAGTSGGPPPPVASSASNVRPEVVGVRPDMAFDDAYKRLRAYNPKAKIEIGEVQVAEFGPKPLPVTLRLQSPAGPGAEVPEIIEMELTLPPEKPIVWGIVRRLYFPAGKEQTRTSLLADLRRRYGPENHGITVPIVNLYWAFDEEGRRVETTGGPYNNCAVPGPWDLTLNLSATRPGSSRFPGKSLLLDRPAPGNGPCKPLVHVKALLQPSGRQSLELIESMTIAVIDAALAARAQAATSALRARTVEKSKK